MHVVVGHCQLCNQAAEMLFGQYCVFILSQKTEKTYDRKVDIYPLGLIYLELLWKLSSGHERGEVSLA